MRKAHTKEQFNEFMSLLIETNATLDFFSNFEKIALNVEAISIKLNQLNYLIGKEDMDTAIQSLWSENPKVFSVLDILVAIRTSDKKRVLGKDGNIYLVENFFKTPKGVLEYIEGTGLKKVFQNKQITNLVDYVFGVETGLDTNARKNRSGHIMENRIANLLSTQKIPFRQEVYSTEFEEMKCLGEDLKRFDFAIETKSKTYLIEVNFYSGGGSKLNEVARSYSELAPKINMFPNYEFVWITDGFGWKSARNKLEEAFTFIPSIYNLTTINKFIEKIKTEI
ncbi:MAG: type II restriction endonuclease [Bacteroidaceae bacterium]